MGPERLVCHYRLPKEIILLRKDYHTCINVASGDRQAAACWLARRSTLSPGHQPRESRGRARKNTEKAL